MVVVSASPSRRNPMLVLGALMAVLVALLVATAAPQQAEAKAITDTATYSFTSKAAAGGDKNYCAYKITPKSKKITFKGMGYRYKGSDYRTLKKGTYSVKLNSKTKYRNLVSTETDTVKKISKKAAFKRLKKGDFISVNLVVKKGVVKTLTFGV